MSYFKLNFGIVISDNHILMHLLWADDLILVSDSVEGLQTQLDGLFNFCKDSHMIVNEMKTKVVLFGNANMDNSHFIYNNKVLEVVGAYKYLGLTFNSTKTMAGNLFKEAIKQTRAKATRACFKIRKDTKAIGKPPPTVLLKLFDSLVMPILEYGSEIYFNNKENTTLEKVQLKYLKMMLSVHSNTSSLAIYGDTGRYPLFIKAKQRAIKFWARIAKLKDESLVKMVYNVLYSLDNVGLRNWATHIKCCLSDLGYEHIWLQQSCSDEELKCIKRTIINNYERAWHVEVTDVGKNPKLRTYCIFKTTFGVEPYLHGLIDSKLIKVLSGFRMSCHPLAIEKGRHQKPKIPVEDRVCVYCDKNAIEDEQHFLMECTCYHTIRETLFAKRSSLNLENNDFISLMSCDKSVFYLAKALTSMLNKRKANCT